MVSPLNPLHPKDSMKLSGHCMSALFAVLISASAVTGQPVRTDFSALPTDNPTVHVLDDAGKETKGRLVRFDATSLTLDVNKTETRIDQQHVSGIYVRDSLTNGMLTGLFTGIALGVVGGLSASDCGGLIFADSSRPCTGADKAGIAGVLSAFLGGIGLGVGAGIDALIPGRKMLYERPGSGGATLSVTPAAARHGAGIAIALRW